MPHETPEHAFAAWYAEACATEPDVPDAMQLATVEPDGRPSLRTVLMKDFDASGVVFYTNLGSRKARALVTHSACSGLFHWKSLARQVIVEGTAVPVSETEADAYFTTRPRGSQLGAWASRQSEVLDGAATLEARMAHAEQRFAGVPVPRPPFWSGFRIVVDRWELWQGRPDRLHERRVWVRQGEGWERRLLFP